MVHTNKKFTGHQLFTLFFFCIVVLASCKKNDNKPQIEPLTLGIVLGNDTTISLSELNEPLTAISSDNSIASAIIEGTNVKITSHKLGYAEIRILNQGYTEKAVLQVWVNRGYNLFQVSKYEINVVATDESAKNNIEYTLTNSVPLPVNAFYGFNLLSEPSVLYIFPEDIEEEPLSGTVSFNPQSKIISLYYNDEEFHYEIVINPAGLKMKGKDRLFDSPISKVDYGFLEDLTEEFKTEYPEAGITSVQRIHYLQPVP